MSEQKKSERGAPSPKHKEPLRDLPKQSTSDDTDKVRGGKTPATPSPIPMPYPN